MDLAPIRASITSFAAAAKDVAARANPAKAVAFARDNANMVKFSLANWNHPVRMGTALLTGREALAAMPELFTWSHWDTVTDATLHTWMSGLVTSRLAKQGMDPEAAAAFARRFGQVHELDSGEVGIYRQLSNQMDLHNNEVGIELGLRNIAHGESEEQLLNAVFEAVGHGRTLVLPETTGPLRASTAAELNALRRR